MSTLITCHANADFDALSAIVGASLIYPGSLLLFPGTQERSLQKFFTEQAAVRHTFLDIRELKPEEVELLVVVDTRQRGRIPHVHAILDNPHLRIHIWDHHPPSTDDLPADALHADALGSTTTLLIRELRARGMTLTPEDATLLGLGIYGDTGSFTFASTTPEDFTAAAWLRSQGMRVNDIADYAAHELTSLHVQALNSLLESAVTYHIGKTPVVMAEVSMENYLGDFAYLAHKLMEMEHFDVLFALGRMADRVHVVARSRREEVNVGQVCSALGGGGHAYAASASVRDKTIAEVRDSIFRQLYAQANAEQLAGHYMSSPAIGIEEQHSLSDASELMGRFGLKAVPVFATGTRHCVGILDYQTAVRATRHALEGEALSVYMQRRIRTVPPDGGLQELVDIIINDRQRLVPVVDGEDVAGVVTRTDLINVFAEEPGRVAVPVNQSRKERNITKQLRDRLPKDVRELLERAGALGDRLGMPVYAVGGFVRDLLLEHANQDVDLVVEGDGIAYAHELAAALQGRVRPHLAFHTAIVIYHDEKGRERHIDVATARLEYYEYPAALPTVELSSIKMDLFRRDFTVNALAVRLNKGVFGQLVDFFGGQKDIRDKLIRVLHTLSFVEDPTRCLRAVRFEQRYGFRIGPNAEKLVKNALQLQLLDRVSGPRLFHELQLICEEADPVACLVRLDALGLLKAIHPLITLNSVKNGLLRRIRDIIDWYRLLYFDRQPRRWLLYLLALCRNSSYQDTSAVFQRLGIPQTLRTEALRDRERMRSLNTRVENWHREADQRTSAFCDLLQGISLEGILYMMARTDADESRKMLSRYITQWSREKLDIDGKDLIRMGLRPGPLFGRIMKQLLAAKRNGEAPTRDLQMKMAMLLATQAPGQETQERQTENAC